MRTLEEVEAHSLPDGWNEGYTKEYVVFRRHEYNAQRKEHDSPEITMTVEQFAKQLQHKDYPSWFLNLPRSREQYHRCLNINVLDHVDGPSLEFHLEVNGSRVSSVRHSVNDLFLLLPRLTTWLMEQEAKR